MVTIAHVVRPRGNRGEVSAISASSRPDRFRLLQEAYLAGPDGKPWFDGKPLEVESVWEHGDRLIFKFRGVETISDAERLRGADICVPLSQRMPLEPGEYYYSDLVDCELIESATGQAVGRVTGWQETGVSALLTVEGRGGEEILVPFTRSILKEFDLKNRRIVADLPEGLKDLNG